MYDKRTEPKKQSEFSIFIINNWKKILLFILIGALILFPIQISNILSHWFNDFIINFIKNVNWNLK